MPSIQGKHETVNTRKKNKRPLKKRLRRNAAYILIAGIIGFFRIIPRKAALMIGGLIGRIVPYMAVKERRLAREHLTIAFGDEKTPAEIDRLSRVMFRYMALNFVDTVRLAVMSPEEVIDASVTHNMDRLEKALGKGKGVMGLTSHAGCWELLGTYLSVTGIPMAAIAKRLYDERLEKLLVANRAHGGIANISRGHDTRDIIRYLKKNYVIGILIDQDTKVKGVFVDFFGKPTHTAIAPALLSIKYDAAILPILTYRDEQHRHHICIGEPVEIEQTGDRDADITALTAKCSKVIEEFFREHPEQWVWFHKRWKTRPEPKQHSEKQTVNNG